MIIFSISILVGATFLAFGLFFYEFNGKLSNNHQDWGAFGSYLSGTLGVLAACLAVIWLMMSVHLQKVELQQLKDELTSSAAEQKKQTYISALSALISSSRQAVSEYQNDIIALKDGYSHILPLASDVDIRMALDEESRKIFFYQKQLECYLEEKYIDPYANKETEGADDDQW